MMASISLPVGGVAGVLGDGNHTAALAPEQGLEGHGVLPLAGKPGKPPDQNHLQWGRSLAALVDHLAELGPVGDHSALCLVHVFAGDRIHIVLGVAPKGP